MFSKLLCVWRKKKVNHVTACFMLVLLTSALFSVHGLAQTQQTTLLPGNGAPLLVTPEVHLSSPALSVGASNATAGNAAGATNQTVGRPTMANDLGAVLQYAGPAYTVTITPNPGTLQGAAAPSTPEVHLGAMPEYNVRGSTVTIIPPPGALADLPPSRGGETRDGAQFTNPGAIDLGVGQAADLVTDRNAPETNLGAVALEYRRRRLASSTPVSADQNIDLKGENREK